MEKILVTTDQSANSKAAIRFAIKLARQRKAELIILHVYHLLKPFKWSDHAFAEYTDSFRKKTVEELSSFIAGIYHDIDEPEINHQLVLVSNIDVVDGIKDYAGKYNCSYICISTRGAGALTKIFGTHTAKLINSSSIPVLCIPSGYHLKDLKHILYASDMTDYENELKKVVDFARPIHASVEMMHIAYPHEFAFDKELAEATLQKKTDYKVTILNPQRDITNALLQDIDHAVKISKPSLLVLFTHQSRSMFEKLFFPSNAEEYSFYGKIPLLTFNKKEER
ncbi:Nucleotide-binding universal stress protein, UspA family [Mucilaginibacter sp. OK268]|uniref:universal stress protein n=1 Tax=Mucilaginibacter sp. OK268 TaxID=1881048 RepID=UPI00088F7007|nr:universal stress protein [Mucilaginibacter sp. OK268]SDP97143.1 Nucleotide-binding universal stress protein, UspA family [Mucilaginibacter sp. OK268]